MDNNNPMDDYRWNLIIRCLSGNASPDEQENMEEWLSLSFANREFYNNIKIIWDDANVSIPDYDKKEVYQLVQQKISESERSRVQEPQLISQNQIEPGANFRWLKIAVSLAFIMLLTFSMYWLISRTEAVDAQWVTVTSKAGKRSKVFLPDSSIVWLNANSTLHYPRQFPLTHRDVRLDGEAFFEVTENAKSPFVVTTGSIRTTVLGTSFNVNSENEAKEVFIVVLSGKVKVSRVAKNEAEQQLGFLKPNEQMSCNQSNSHFKIKSLSNAYEYVSWKDGVLRFRDMDFEQIARKIERWYDVKIIFKNAAVRKCQFEGTFNNVPVEKVMNMLRMTANFEYVMQGDSITISGKGCH